MQSCYRSTLLFTLWSFPRPCLLSRRSPTAEELGKESGRELDGPVNCADEIILIQVHETDRDPVRLLLIKFDIE